MKKSFSFFRARIRTNQIIRRLSRWLCSFLWEQRTLKEGKEGARERVGVQRGIMTKQPMNRILSGAKYGCECRWKGEHGQIKVICEQASFSGYSRSADLDRKILKKLGSKTIVPYRGIATNCRRKWTTNKENETARVRVSDSSGEKPMRSGVKHQAHAHWSVEYSGGIEKWGEKNCETTKYSRLRVRATEALIPWSRDRKTILSSKIKKLRATVLLIPQARRTSRDNAET